MIQAESLAAVSDEMIDVILDVGNPIRLDKRPSVGNLKSNLKHSNTLKSAIIQRRKTI